MGRRAGGGFNRCLASRVGVANIESCWQADSPGGPGYDVHFVEVLKICVCVRNVGAKSIESRFYQRGSFITLLRIRVFMGKDCFLFDFKFTLSNLLESFVELTLVYLCASFISLRPSLWRLVAILLFSP